MPAPVEQNINVLIYGPALRNRRHAIIASSLHTSIKWLRNEDGEVVLRPIMYLVPLLKDQWECWSWSTKWMFECTMPLYREADWRIWQSMALDEIPPGNRAETRADFRKCGPAGLFCIRAIIRDIRMVVYNRALCPMGEFKMRAAAYPGLHGVRKDVPRDIRIRIYTVVFKHNLSPHLKYFQVCSRNASHLIIFTQLSILTYMFLFSKLI